jgi:hypothetical protein
MNRIISPKSLAATALALGAIVAASAAHARSDVYFSVGIQHPGVYVQPAPVYVQPQPVYVQPRHVYVQPQPVYVQPRHVYVQPQPVYPQGYYGQGSERRGPYGDRDRDGIANVYDRDGHRHQQRHGHRYGPYGDLDRDGVRNMDDRDRDGDGVRNRYDRVPSNPYYR